MDPMPNMPMINSNVPTAAPQLNQYQPMGNIPDMNGYANMVQMGQPMPPQMVIPPFPNQNDIQDDNHESKPNIFNISLLLYYN